MVLCWRDRTNARSGGPARCLEVAFRSVRPSNGHRPHATPNSRLDAAAESPVTAGPSLAPPQQPAPRRSLRIKALLVLLLAFASAAAANNARSLLCTASRRARPTPWRRRRATHCSQMRLGRRRAGACKGYLDRAAHVAHATPKAHTVMVAVDAVDVRRGGWAMRSGGDTQQEVLPGD